MVEIFEINEMREFQKILKVKSSYKSDIQGKGNLGANTTFLGIQNVLYGSMADTRIIRGHRLPISWYRDKLSATYRGQIAVSKIVDFLYNIRFS